MLSIRHCNEMMKASAMTLSLFLILFSTSKACTQIIMGGPGMAYPSEVMSARNVGFFGSDTLRVR